MNTLTDIFYDCPRYTVIDKPAGADSEKLPDLLSAQTGEKHFSVHRLDKDVSGLMILAKSPEAAGELSKIKYRKEYLALVLGCPDPEEGTFEDFLFHDRAKNKTYVVKKERKGVKKAVLRYKVLEKGEKASLVSVLLETGRTHQIRVQFASRGMPLAGDAKYGGGKGTPALRAVRLTFTDPFDGEKKDFCLKAVFPGFSATQGEETNA
ncbi:MAG: RNA pseudouridine synthase [Clostridia bacterium]|nr:RNA pseudouridine synthase [Clostridia bacterium]